MKKTDETIKNKKLKKDTKVVEQSDTKNTNQTEASHSFIERNKEIILGAISGLTVGIGLSVASGLSIGIIAVISVSSSIVGYGLIHSFSQTKNKDKTKPKEALNNLNFKKETYKTAYEIQLANAKRDKKSNIVVAKFEKLVSDAQKTAPLSEQSTKNLLNIYKKGTEALKHLNDDDANYFINLKIQELEELKKKKRKSR